MRRTTSALLAFAIAIAALLASMGQASAAPAPAAPVAAAASTAVPANVAPATADAGTTTDYAWSGWRACAFTPFTYENVRWRIDYRHNPTTTYRDARAITYVDIQGSTTVHIEYASEEWPGAALISQTPIRTVDKANDTWYVGNYMAWVAINNAANVRITLKLLDGKKCAYVHTM